MKLQFLTVAAAALMVAPMLHAQATTAVPVAAKTARSVPRRGHMKELGLTAAQKASMKAIRARYAPQMKSARDAFKPDFDAMKAARTRRDTAAMRAARAKLQSDMAPSQKIREQEMAEMRGVLTPAQQQKFDAQRAQMKTHMSNRGDRGGWMGRKHPAKPPTPAGPAK